MSRVAHDNDRDRTESMAIIGAVAALLFALCLLFVIVSAPLWR